MPEKKLTVQRGLTLTELVVAAAASTIVIFAIAVVLVDSHRGWHTMYKRIYAEVVTDSYVAR